MGSSARAAVQITANGRGRREACVTVDDGRSSESWQFVALNLAPSRARQVIRDYAAAMGVRDDVLTDVLLCVSEAVTNVVMHAYLNREEPGTVEVEVRRERRFLELTVRDNGNGFTYRRDSPGLGVGLPVIRQLTHSFELRSPAHGGTELAMRFRL